MTLFSILTSFSKFFQVVGKMFFPMEKSLFSEIGNKFLRYFRIQKFALKLSFDLIFRIFFRL